jgi:hypothetical protein
MSRPRCVPPESLVEAVALQDDEALERYSRGLFENQRTRCGRVHPKPGLAKIEGDWGDDGFITRLPYGPSQPNRRPRPC